MEVLSINPLYASAGRRLVAWFIDKIFISLIISATVGWLFHIPHNYYYDVLDYRIFHGGFFFYKVFKVGVTILYFALMESSSKQATLGKIVMNIRVTGQQGERIPLDKALLRNVSKLISGLILGIGYLMIIFDQKKQGLHDKIADTYVINN